MSQGLYTYCILSGQTGKLTTEGLFGRPVYTVDYKDISAVVSDVPFKKIQPGMNDIVAHNKVVDAARNLGIVLPIRFGVIFRNAENAKKLLRTSYDDYKKKLSKLRGKDELSVKIVLEKNAMKKIMSEVRSSSTEARKLSENLSAADKGASYFIKLKLDDLLKNESLARLSQISDDSIKMLSSLSEESRVLKTNVQDIVIDSVFLIRKERMEDFSKALQELESRYRNVGLTFHMTGPWAPYSFC